jgi:hypothetical protein
MNLLRCPPSHGVTVIQVYQIPQSAMSGPELQSVVVSVVQCIGGQSSGGSGSDAVSMQAL